MAEIEALSVYRWPTEDFPLASLDVRLSELASRLRIPVYTWEEDGLGPASGVACRLGTGFVFLLRELEHAVEHLGSTGPDIYVDAEDVASAGVESLVSVILDALALSESNLVWVQESAIRDEAAQRAEWAREYRAQRRRDLGSDG